MKKIVGLLLLTLTAAVAAQATTLWGVTGDNLVSDGTLVAQNFDYNPKYTTRLQFVVSKTTGYRYLAEILYGPGINPSVQGGINEKGLAAVGSPSLNKATTAEARPGFNEWVLSSYGSVDDFLTDQDQAVNYSPGFYLIADSVKIALIEISPQGGLNVQGVTDGPACRSNREIAYARIKGLLAEHPGLFNLDDLITYSRDRHDGPNNSIWRTGTAANSERTLATLAVSLPESGAPQAYIRLAGNNEGKSGKLTLDADFWSSQAAGDVEF